MSTKSDKAKTILVFGIGKLGGPLVDVLAIRYPQHVYVLVSRDLEKSQKRANLSRYLALQWGLSPEIIGEQANLHDISQTAELINKYQPDVVFNATTPFPWWKIDSLPKKEKELANKVGPGIWCALDCLLPMLLTEALSSAASKAVHVNGCYPDMTNSFLSSYEYGPKLGIGNISNLVPGLQLGFANELAVSPEEIEIKLIGHHYISYNAPTTQGCPDGPYELSVIYPNGKLHFSGPNDAPFEVLRNKAPRVRGLDGLGVTIGSAATLLSSFLGSSQRQHHSPGANGLPGGYPVIIDSQGMVTLNLPDEISEQQAILINEKAQVFDGIAHVEAGVVMATSAAREAHSEIIGTDLPQVTLANVFDLSLDTLARLGKRFDLNLNP